MQVPSIPFQLPWEMGKALACSCHSLWSSAFSKIQITSFKYSSNLRIKSLCCCLNGSVVWEIESHFVRTAKPGVHLSATALAQCAHRDRGKCFTGAVVIFRWLWFQGHLHTMAAYLFMTMTRLSLSFLGKGSSFLGVARWAGGRLLNVINHHSESKHLDRQCLVYLFHLYSSEIWGFFHLMWHVSGVPFCIVIILEIYLMACQEGTGIIVTNLYIFQPLE